MDAAKISRVAEQAAPELAVVVPTFNERANIEKLYEKLSITLRSIAWEMIVVDDNSPDKTADVAWSLGRRHPNIRCIKRVGRRGLSSACTEGILSTSAPYVAVIDGDLQHDERILPTMLQKARSGADIVVGTRYSERATSEGFSAARQLGSTLATRMSALLTGRFLSDPMSGFFLVRRDLFVGLAPSLSSEGFKILLDLVVTATRQGSKPEIAEIPYEFRERNAGDSKMSPLVVSQFLGLWFSKLTGDIVPPSFLLFSLVGLSGVAVHLAVLWALTSIGTTTFIVAQVTATMAAMTWNFAVNNVLTYADRKLKGIRFWTGLLSFYAVCSLGAIANISVASLIYEMRSGPILAGLAGALMSSVFNYSVTRVITWR